MKTVFVSVNSKFIHTSLAIRYLREYSMKNGLRTDIREYTINNDIEKAVIDLYNADSEIYGFSTYIFNLRHTLDIIKDLKKLRPDSIIFCGGPEVSYGYEQMLRENPCIDFIIRGEGEESVFRFLKTACECESACELKSYLAQNPECGVSFLYQNTLIDSPERAPIPDLDIIPFAYNENELSALKDRILYYESSRGCPFGCTYCMSSICHGVRVFSLKRVFEDLKRLIDSSVKQVKFVDRTFNFDKNRALKIWRFLKNNDNKHTNFHFEISIWLIDDETIDFLKTVRKGLFQFEIGIQSANDKTLEAINRKVGFDRISGAFTKMRNAGIIRKNICDRKGGLIKIHGDIISALPYEDINEFKNTFNRSFGLFPDELQLGFLKILKGTEISVQPEHGYVVSSRPPYEVLRNNYISYDDIVQLKYVEQCVEFYYNSCLCLNTIEFFGRLLYSCDNYEEDVPGVCCDYFSFFRDLSDYMRDRAYFDVNHRTMDLFNVMYDFLAAKADCELVENILAYDLFAYGRVFNKPTWLKHVEIDREYLKVLLNSESGIKAVLDRPELEAFSSVPAKNWYRQADMVIFTYSASGIKSATNKLYLYGDIMNNYDI